MEGGFEVFDFSQASAMAVRNREGFVFLDRDFSFPSG
jgi:hypothetical protein